MINIKHITILNWPSQSPERNFTMCGTVGSFAAVFVVKSRATQNIAAEFSLQHQFVQLQHKGPLGCL